MYIEVNYKVLRDAASAVVAYCDAQDREMRSADLAVKDMLLSDWIGADAQEFGRKWEGVNDNDSTAAKFREALKKFSQTLKSSADFYQTAQAESYNEANKLPKWLLW